MNETTTVDRVTRPAPTRVADVMTEAVVLAYQAAPLHEIVRALRRNHIHAVPVIDSDRRVVGVVSISDVLRRRAAAGDATGRRFRPDRVGVDADRRADEIMTSPAATVTPEMSLEHAARQALRAGASTLPVVDDAGRLLGVVSGWDLLAALLDERRAGAGSTAR